MIDRILSDSQSLGFCQSGDFAAAASRLNEIAPLQRDTTLRGFGWLSTNMPDDVEAILAGFEAAEAAAGPGGPLAAYKFRIEETRKLLTTSGIDWSTQLLQDLLPVVGQLCGWSESLVQRVQGIGVSRVLVTAEQVAQEWQAYTQSLIESQVATVLNEIVNPAIATGDLQAISAALRQAADRLEG